ncbi:DEAD/DEAH box helicase [Prevotella sp.]|uniref:DEAD/DEAH box helicase n=1 Tax=uncultured Prevotella sp. TaxID=159272 RepID=UPI0025ED3208|nr:DEAD/DEAH box helicase [Prevotella sp.]
MNTQEILAKLHISELGQMQKDASAAVLHTDRDVVILAPTGSGKTLAYLLPLVQRLDAAIEEVQAVVIVPSRELALQSNDVFRSMGCGLRSMCLYGGRPTMDEHRAIQKVRPQVIFATPGRLNDHLDKQNFAASDVRWLVIDEFDKCLRMGFRAEMEKAVDSLPTVERRILLSATDAEEMPRFVRMGRTERVDYLDEEETTPDRIGLYVVHSPEKDKLNTLDMLLRDFGAQQTIVFLNYRDGVERTAKFLTEKGYVVSAFHGGLDQRQREEAIYRFANRSANILVSTDLASRGLDIPDVENIVHYNLPVGEEEFVHRVGRTGRWDATGRAFMLLGPEEHMPEYVTVPTEDYVPANPTAPVAMPVMSTLYIGKGKKDKISKGDILGFLCKTCSLSSSDIGRIDVYERFAYVAVSRKLAKKTMEKAKGAKIKGLKTVVELAF